MFHTYGAVLEALRMRGISPATLSAAVATAGETGRPLRDVLVDDGMVTDNEFAEALADAYGLTAVELDNFPIDAAATAKIPVAMARRHRVLGMAMNDDEIVVAITDPGDVLALDDVRAATGMTVRPVVASRGRAAHDHRAAPARGERPRRRRRKPGPGFRAEHGHRARVGRGRGADRALRQLADRAGHPQPRLRPAPRADRARHAGALPHRRRAARDRHRARSASSRR